jgi:SAM-dependent methyltransferase
MAIRRHISVAGRLIQLMRGAHEAAVADSLIARFAGAQGEEDTDVTVPHRIAWAVERLAIRGGERVLEIGCGRGVAAGLICGSQADCRVLGIDRSPTAIRTAEARNQEHLTHGRLRLVQVALEDFDPGPERFDVIFAINVNLFWIDAGRGLDACRRALGPSGTLHLIFEPPSGDRRADVETRLGTRLGDAGWSVRDRLAETRDGAPLLWLKASPTSA